MKTLSMTEEDVRIIVELLTELTQRYQAVEDPSFLNDCAILAHELPISVRTFLNDFRLSDPAWGTCVVSGYPIDDTHLGQTPKHWKVKPKHSPALAEEMFLVLLGSLLGDVFGWAAEQEGRIVHDVIPIKEHETKQMGTGSEQVIWWHTEEAFHPYSSDYIGLICLRNHESVATTFAHLDISKLDAKHVKILFEPRFTIRPVESHFQQAVHGSDPSTHADARTLQHVEETNPKPQKISILYGDKKSPYIRIDPYFMDRLDSDPEAQQSLEFLIEAIDSYIDDCILHPGDVCFLDNYKAVHGRKPFKAKYDGTDRWLKRINMTRDLRKSSGSRPHASSRLIR